MQLTHRAVELDEIQSKHPEEVIEHKVRQAYQVVQQPVIVDDFSLWFDELDGLPGPFIKFFVTANNGLENLCRMADGLSSRRATARAYVGYFDGNSVKIMYGELKGEIAQDPRGKSAYAFGSDPVFCVDGYGGRSRAELDHSEYDEVYRKLRAIDDVRVFLEGKV